MSFGFIGSIFSYYWGSSAQQSICELSILLDADILSSPSKLKEGFDLFIKDTSKDETKIGENISHLSELDLNVEYYTERGTKVIRISHSEVILGDKTICVPVLRKGETYETTRNISQYCMKGFLESDSLVVAIEKFCGMRINSRGVLLYENGNSRNVFVSEDLSNLELDVTYVAPNGSIILKKHAESGKIEFSFGRNLWSNANQKSHNNNTNSNSNTNMNRNRKKGRKGLIRTETHHIQPSSPPPQSPRVVTRRAKKRPFENPASTLSLEAIQTPSSDKKRKTTGRENSQSQSELHNSPVKEIRTSEQVPTPSATPVTSAPLASPAPTSISKAPPSISKGPPPIPKAPPPPPAPKVPAPPAPPASNLQTKRPRLRPLHWKAIPKNKLESTFWSKLETIPLGDMELEEEQNKMNQMTSPNSTEPNLRKSFEKEVDGFFSLTPDKIERSPSKSASKLVAKKKIHLLDVKRSNNTGILLSQFKMSFTDIKQSILELDSLLTIEHLMSLKYMFPLTENEKKAFEQFTGTIDDLATTEQFYFVLLSIPRLEQKINLFLFKRQFEEQIEALKQSASTLTLASKELQNSAQFAKILKWIYTIGSYLNRDTRLSESVGFSLESLPKIIETKTGQANVTFIDFLVSKVYSSNPEILHFVEELPNLELASKLSLEILNNHKAETAFEINELRKEISFYESCTNMFTNEDRFLVVMKPFMCEADATFKLVSSEVEETVLSFNKVVEYFGDDSKTATPGSFFQNIVTFSNAFRKSHHLLIEKQKKLDREKLKELDQSNQESVRANKMTSSNPKQLTRRHTTCVDQRSTHTENDENTIPGMAEQTMNESS